MKERTAWRRWLRRALVSVLGLLLVLGLVLSFALGTRAGRNLTLGYALSVINETIPGRLLVGDFKELSLHSLELSEVALFDPASTEVVKLGTLRLELDLLSLRPDDIRIDRVMLSDGFLDLSQMGQPHHGLLAALVDPAAPPSPPSEGPLPYVLLEDVSLDAIAVELPATSPLAPTQIADLSLDGRFELDESPTASVRSLTLVAKRGSEQLLTLRRLEAELARGGEPSRVSLTAELLGTELELSAQGVLPPALLGATPSGSTPSGSTPSGSRPSDATRWKSAPVHARLAVSDLTAGKLAQLFQDDSLGQSFSGPLGLVLDVTGTVNQLQGTLDLSTAGGSARLEAALTDLRALTFVLAASELTPAGVVPGTAAQPVSAELSGKADLGNVPERMPLELHLREASFAGESLPELDATLVVTQAGVRELQLKGRDDVSLIDVSGQAGFDGSADLRLSLTLQPKTLRRVAALIGQRRKLSGSLHAKLHLERDPRAELQVHAEVTGRKLGFDELTLDRFAGKVSLAGQFPTLGGSADIELDGLKANEVQLDAVRLELRGGPKHYEAQLRARAPQGDLKLDSSLSVDASALSLKAKGSGHYQGHPVSLRVAPTRFGFGGTVDTRGVELDAAGTKMTVTGSMHQAKTALTLEANDMDLEALAKLFSSSTPVAGRTSLRAELRGSLTRPELEFRLTGTDVRLGRRPRVNAAVSGRLDASAGTTLLELELADAHPPGQRHELELSARAQSRFSTAKPWFEALAEGQLRVHMDLKHVESTLVQAMIPDTALPVTGHFEGTLDADGTLSDPRVALALNAELGVPLTAQTLNAAYHLSVSEAGLQTELSLEDDRGEWVSASATSSLPPLPELLDDPRQMLATERWQLSVSVAERQLDALTFDGVTRLPPSVFSASLDASHEPNAEPEAVAHVALRQTGSVDSGLGCRASGLAIDAKLVASQGRLNLTVSGEHAQRELVHLEAQADLRLAHDARLGALSAQIRSTKLDLATLPFVCNRFAGVVDLDADIQSPLGEHPRAAVELNVHGFSAGGREGVDAQMAFSLSSALAKLDAKVIRGADISTASASLPLRISGGKLSVAPSAPLAGQVILRHLPIAPLLDPDGAVSYATGTVSGEVELLGTWQHPKLNGALDLEQLGFTATNVAQPLRNIGGHVEFSETELRVRRLVAHDRDGQLRIDGRFDFANPKRVEGDFKVKAEDFPLRQQGQVVATIQVDARLRSTITPERTRLRVDLYHVDTWLEQIDLRQGMSLAGHEDVVVDGVPAKAQKEAPDKPGAEPKPASAERQTEIVLHAEDAFWVKRDDFAVKLATLLKIDSQGDNVKVEGEVKLDRGYLQLMGKVFEIERGSTLRFIGSPKPDPVLNISALHENRRSGQDVAIHITGRGSAPILQFMVDDQTVTAGDAFGALFGSQHSNEDPSASNDQARQFVGGLTAGVLATAARRQLGAAAPIIMIEPKGETEESRVRAGFELDSLVPRFLRDAITGVYIEGIVSNAQDANNDANVHGGVLIELYFPRAFFGAMQYGPGPTWSVDAGWQL